MPDEPQQPVRNRVVAFLMRPNPYCSFNSDEWRYKAMRSRDIRLGVVAIASLAGGILLRYAILRG